MTSPTQTQREAFEKSFEQIGIAGGLSELGQRLFKAAALAYFEAGAAWKSTPQSPVPGVNLTGVMLRRQGGEDDPLAYAVVEVEIGGKWVEVIREMLSTNFSHIVNPSGILECQERSKK